MSKTKKTDPNLTTIHLVGSLGERFGKTWHLDVKSPAEAIRAIDVNTRGALAAYLRGPGRERGFTSTPIGVACAEKYLIQPAA